MRFFLVLLFLCCMGPVFAEPQPVAKFSNPTLGFTYSASPQFLLVDNPKALGEVRAKGNELLSGEGKESVKSERIGLHFVAALMPECKASVNLATEELAASAMTTDQYLTMAVASLPRLLPGAKIKGAIPSRTIGGRKFKGIAYDATMGGAPYSANVYINCHKGLAYVITLGDRSESFAKHKSLLEKSLTGFQFSK